MDTPIVLEGRIARGLSTYKHLVISYETHEDKNDSYSKLEKAHARICKMLQDDGTKTKKGLLIPFAQAKPLEVKVHAPYTEETFVVKVSAGLANMIPDVGTFVRIYAKPRTYKFEKDKVLSIGWCLDLKRIQKTI